MKRLILFPALAVLAFHGAALGAPQPAKPAKRAGDITSAFGGHNSNAPIAVSADSFQGDINAKVGTYVGNVIVTQGDVKLRADRVRVSVAGGKPDHIDAVGHVVLVSASGTATGENGVYDVGPRIVTLTGNVVLTKDKNVMRGTSLQVNLVTGQAQLQAKGAAGGRVQGIFTPPPQSNSGTNKGK
ncbi:MAG TPA: lipopolysaccharide transport periplasmic protein LptA [Rhizomicrobium sp.]|jgi:lipopolysaccharide export system protein LptA|nr:lipopolysaccharide transport periplasmic protein LptA [Rhizomicrobium sp.]